MPDNHPVDFDARVKVTVYRAIAESGSPPSLEAVSAKMGATPAAIKESYVRLRASRLLLLEPDGVTIRMAPPFSGVPTQHRVSVDGMEYYANCAWDALGIPAAFHRPGGVQSRCEQSLEPPRLEIGVGRPGPSTGRCHSL